MKFILCATLILALSGVGRSDDGVGRSDLAIRVTGLFRDAPVHRSYRVSVSNRPRATVDLFRRGQRMAVRTRDARAERLIVTDGREVVIRTRDHKGLGVDRGPGVEMINDVWARVRSALDHAGVLLEIQMDVMGDVFPWYDFSIMEDAVPVPNVVIVPGDDRLTPFVVSMIEGEGSTVSSSGDSASWVNRLSSGTVSLVDGMPERMRYGDLGSGAVVSWESIRPSESAASWDRIVKAALGRPSEKDLWRRHWAKVRLFCLAHSIRCVSQRFDGRLLDQPRLGVAADLVVGATYFSSSQIDVIQELREEFMERIRVGFTKLGQSGDSVKAGQAQGVADLSALLLERMVLEIDAAVAEAEGAELDAHGVLQSRRFAESLKSSAEAQLNKLLDVMGQD